MSRLLSWLVRAVWSWARRHADIRPGTRAARRFARYGPGTSIAFPVATVFGEPWIELGAHTILGADITLTAGMMPGLDLGSTPYIRIGDGCTIGRGSHIVAHRSIEIGDDVFAGPYVYITDQNHVYSDVEVPVGRQWPADAPVCVAAGSWIGANAVILPGVRLGRNCVVAAGSVVRPGSYPDHSVIAGVPGRVVRRYDPETGWTPPLRGAGGQPDHRCPQV
ncbi:acetyltransferase-like isoleucine patch superfamily enzyme [Lipingzhangella halophila]|uniref:Acetyltransferase-like isoleucine patch superfamily enzyme n=1 Tax=Lipingzhangella halophila TaxID=1783352 RepID=A0A7W7W1H1_9ACTN|nr:DapH/DapD/GlmU-related protein [Lipingzhangella halophila]MBB4929759.1 acetyltransferase-like isoleucine patch superfamily enzyme [Lipingzhangella halophila]